MELNASGYCYIYDDFTPGFFEVINQSYYLIKNIHEEELTNFGQDSVNNWLGPIVHFGN